MALECRSCLASVSFQECVGLESTLSDEITYLDFFNQCTRLRACGDDELPGSICLSCSEQLQVTYDFVQQAQKADAKLRSKLKLQMKREIIECLEFVEMERDDVECIEQFVEHDEDADSEVMQVETVEEHLLDDAVDVTEEYLDEKPHVEQLIEETPTELSIEKLHSTVKEERNIRDANPDYYPDDELDDEYMLEYEDVGDSNAPGDTAANGTKWKCIECQRVLRGDVSYEGHMNLHKGVRPYRCSHCQSAFRCKYALERHAEQRHQIKVSSKRFSCELCQKAFRLQTLLEQHQANEHFALLPSTVCAKCTKTFDSAAELDEHMQLVHANTSASHIAADTGEAQKRTPWQCDICKRYLRSANNLSSHMRVVHSPEAEANKATQDSEAEVQCQVCKRQLLRRNLDKHMALHARKEREAADGQTKFLCAYCPRECKNKKTLYQHEKMHEGESPLVVYVCPDCNRQYNTQYLLQQHRKQAHKERDHVCPICGNAFKLKNQLMNHMKLHLEKNIACTHCDKKYARQVDLNVHMRSHTGETPYECHLCSKRFAIKVRLTYHLQKHYGIKHVCKECNAEFNSKQKLKAHSFKHTGMPYRCETCDNHGFANRDVFKRHLLRVHNATMTDEELVEMFQRNTGKTTRIRTISESVEQVVEDSMEADDPKPQREFVQA